MTSGPAGRRVQRAWPPPLPRSARRPLFGPFPTRWPDAKSWRSEPARSGGRASPNDLVPLPPFVGRQPTEQPGNSRCGRRRAAKRRAVESDVNAAIEGLNAMYGSERAHSGLITEAQAAVHDRLLATIVASCPEHHVQSPREAAHLLLGAKIDTAEQSVAWSRTTRRE